MSVRCLLGIHSYQGLLHMRCGCGWNRCVRCGKPKGLRDDSVKTYHEKHHES